MTDLLRVLVVDDDRGIQRLLGTLMTREGHAVRICSDGVGALAAIEEWAPDLILLDLMLPRMSGFDVLRRLADQQAQVLQRIIVVTAASTSVLHQLDPYRSSIKRLIRKPFDIVELVSAVRERAALQDPELGDEKRSALSAGQEP